MKKEDAINVKEGDNLMFKILSNTPGRNFGPGILDVPVNILRVKLEGTGHVHFDVGLRLPEGELPLKSRDTGEEIDGSDTYWLHPSRFSV